MQLLSELCSMEKAGGHYLAEMAKAVLEAGFSLEEIMLSEGNKEGKTYVAMKVQEQKTNAALKKTQKENAKLREEV